MASWTIRLTVVGTKERHMRTTRWTLVLAIVAHAAPLFADAKGRVHIKGADFTVAEAVAYTSDDGVEVALLSGPFDRKEAAKDGKIDSMDMFRLRGANVTLKIGRDGSFSCLDWKSSQGGGSTCNSDFTKALTLTANTADRVAGTLKLNASGDSADVTFDVQVESTATRSGTALPAGGGEPGKAALAHFAAIEKGDFAALKATAPPDVRQKMEASEKDGHAKEMFEMMREFTPRRVRILGGTIDGNEATLDFDGVVDNQPQKGEVDLVRVGGAWFVKGTTMH
jgi:hypothetical protein